MGKYFANVRSQKDTAVAIPAADHNRPRSMPVKCAYEKMMLNGGGIHCSTMPLIRDPI